MEYFRILGLLGIMCSVVWCGPCPSSNYIYCAAEGQYCYVHDGIKEGYISYGADSRWTLIPFTNTKGGGADLYFACNYRLGDVFIGRAKSCCYTNVEMDTGFHDPGFMGQIPHGWTWTHYGMMTQRYGANGQYFYRPIHKTTGPCNHEMFGDPTVGVHKGCNYKYGVPDALQNIPESEWILCGIGDPGQCTGIDTSSASWIRYGDNDKYYYKLVISADGFIDCSVHLFEDPIVGIRKHCWRSPAQYTFLNIAGDWQNIPLCQGCSSNKYSVTEGVDTLTETELTDTWEWSLTATASASYGFASGELSATVANSVTSRQLTSTTLHTASTTEFECTKPYLYQWRTGATQNNGINTQAFTVYGTAYVCSPSYMTPKCPAGYCLIDATHQDCQTCTPDYYAESPVVFDPNPLQLPEPVAIKPNPPQYYLPYSWMQAFGGFILLLVLINVFMICYTKCDCYGQQKRGYDAVKYTDSEADELEVMQKK